MTDDLAQVEKTDDLSDGISATEPLIVRHVPARELEPGRRTVRTGVWLAFSLLFIAFIVLAKVSTHLGVEAVPWDKQGSEYVWRVWWRSRHRIVDLGPAWGSSLVLGVLALVFVVLSVVAVWIALVADERASDGAAASDIEFSFDR